MVVPPRVIVMKVGLHLGERGPGLSAFDRAWAEGLLKLLRGVLP